MNETNQDKAKKLTYTTTFSKPLGLIMTIFIFIMIISFAICGIATFIEPTDPSMIQFWMDIAKTGFGLVVGVLVGFLGIQTKQT